jgi:two-component system, NtrC family, sensor histidine kinase PilS
LVKQNENESSSTSAYGDLCGLRRPSSDYRCCDWEVLLVLLQQGAPTGQGSLMADSVSRFATLLDVSVPSSRELDLSDRESGLPRLWRGFMAARILVAGVLLLLLLYLRASGQPAQSLAFVVCLAYLALTVWVRVLGRPLLPGDRLDPQWLVTVGVDVIVFGLLLYLQVGTINFTPLFALPVLLAAVLGPLLLALGTAAAVTLALLVDALQYTLAGTSDATGRYIQAAVTGIGLFAVAYLTNQLSARLVRQERVAKGSEMAARAQIQVNQLVIDNLGDGVLVIDGNGVVHAANPSAREMLGVDTVQEPLVAKPPFVLAARTAWASLAELAARSLQYQQAVSAEITITDAQAVVRMLHVKSSLSIVPGSAEQGNLCVLFMEDLREVEARVRTEKLAAMGRMSAAVAHEIRNPLSAISQANELLAEEMREPHQQRLVRMVAQNVQRLTRVVDDVLDVSRAESGRRTAAVLRDPSQLIRSVCLDWMQQNKAFNCSLTGIESVSSAIEFEADHLRRILINLLDNALRHASGKSDSIQVYLQQAPTQQGGLLLSIWSDGAPIEQGVQRHLFEPFFSSQSRSSGLGLYICRELCIRHGASINYERSKRDLADHAQPSEGNVFTLHIRHSMEVTQPMPLF